MAVLELQGCAWIQGPPEKDGVNVRIQEAECLASFPSQLSLFAKEPGSRVEVGAEICKCLDQSIEVFVRLVRGSNPDGYSPEEISRFVERYLSPGVPLAQDLVESSSALKRALLGGSDGFVKKEELQRLRKLLRFLGENSGVFASTGEDETKAIEKISAYIQDMISEAEAPSLPFHDFIRWVAALGRISDFGPETTGWVRAAELSPGWAEASFKVLMRSPDARLGLREWGALVRLALRGQSFLSRSEKSKDLIPLLGDLDPLLGEVEKLWENERIPNSWITEWISRMNSAKSVPRFADSWSVLNPLRIAVSTLWVWSSALLREPEQGLDLRSLRTLVRTMSQRNREILTVANFLRNELPSWNAMGAGIRAARKSEVRDAWGRLTSSFLDWASRHGGSIRLALLEKRIQQVETLNPDGVEFQRWARLARESVRVLSWISGSSVEQIDVQGWRVALARGWESLEIALRFLEWDGSSPALEEWIADASKLITFILYNKTITQTELLNAIEALVPSLNDGVAPKWIRRGFWLSHALLGSEPGRIDAFSVRGLAEILQAGIRASNGGLRDFPRFLENLGQMEWSSVESMTREILRAAGELADVLRRHQRPGDSGASFNDWVTLIEEVAVRDFHWVKPREWNSQAVVDAVSSWKQLIVSAPDKHLRADEIPVLISRTAEVAAAAFEILNLARVGENLNHHPGLGRLTQAALRLGKVLVTAASVRSDREAGIPLRSIDQLLSAIYGLLDHYEVRPVFRLNTLRGFLDTAMLRFLTPPSERERSEREGAWLKDGILFTLNLFIEWSQGNEIWDRAFRRLATDPSTAFITDGYTRQALRDELALIENSDPSLQGAARWQRFFLNKLRPLYLGQDSMITIPYDGTRENLYSHRHLSVVNTLNILVRAMVRGYARDPARQEGETGTLKTELVQFVRDIAGLADDLQIGNPNETPENLTNQRFLEANLFTSNGNGDSYFGVAEGVEYLGLLLTAQSYADRAHDEASTLCPSLGIDHNGRNKFTLECFSSVLFHPNRFHRLYRDGFPRMAQFFRDLSPAVRRQFGANVAAASRPKGAAAALPVDSNHVQNFVTLPIYVESLMKRLDSDRNGVLNVTEALRAYPIVCPLILEVTRKPDGSPRFQATCRLGETGFVEAIYGYLLKHGAPPPSNPKNIWEEIEQGIGFLVWYLEWLSLRNADTWGLDFTVDRAKIMGIVGSLAVTR